MRRSVDRILCSHAGSLPRTGKVRDLVLAREEGRQVDSAQLNARLPDAIGEVRKAEAVRDRRRQRRRVFQG